MDIRGFGTRPVTDKVIEDFLSNFNGKFYRALRQVQPYEVSRWQGFSQEEWLEKKYACVVMGILRGTERILWQCRQHMVDYYYFDHAYQYTSPQHNPNKVFGERIYSLAKNRLKLNYLVKINEEDENRIDKYLQKMDKKAPVRHTKNFNNTFFLIVPPSDAVCRYYKININHWQNKVRKKLHDTYEKPYYAFRYKNSKVPLGKDLADAHTVITSQSTVGIEAIKLGIPVICDDMSMCVPVGNSMDGSFQHDRLKFPSQDIYWTWIKGLLANQFTETEIRKGIALEAVNRMQYATLSPNTVA